MTSNRLIEPKAMSLEVNYLVNSIIFPLLNKPEKFADPFGDKLGVTTPVFSQKVSFERIYQDSLENKVIN